MTDTELRHRKIRDRVPMTFVTSEPYIGHLGQGGIGDTRGHLESLLRDCDIRWLTDTRIDRVEHGTVECTEIVAEGKPGPRHSLPSKLTMFIPAFRGVSCLMGDDGKGLSGLADPRGFVLVDKLQCNPTYRNMFAVGVCIAIPLYDKTPVPVGLPKRGYMIESMVTAAAENIGALVAGRGPTQHRDFGNNRAAFVAPEISPRIEKYFLHKVRTGGATNA